TSVSTARRVDVQFVSLKIVKLLDPPLATARSILPSPLKSPATTSVGDDPGIPPAYLTGRARLPGPVQRRSDTPFRKPLPTTTSSCRSRLAPTALRDVTWPSRGNAPREEKPPAPSPRRTRTKPATSSTTRSSLPSPLKSPTARCFAVPVRATSAIRLK